MKDYTSILTPEEEKYLRWYHYLWLLVPIAGPVFYSAMCIIPRQEEDRRRLARERREREEWDRRVLEERRRYYASLGKRYPE